MDRRVVTQSVTDQATRYLVYKHYSVYVEIGVKSRGRRRADVLGMNFKREFVMVEVKSCAADFQSDCKWMEYLNSANKMYLAMPKSFYESKAGQEAASGVQVHGVGVLVCADPEDDKGQLPYVAIEPERRGIKDSHKLYLLTKMAWRGGIHDDKSHKLDAIKTKKEKKRKTKRKKPKEQGTLFGAPVEVSAVPINEANVKALKYRRRKTDVPRPTLADAIRDI